MMSHTQRQGELLAYIKSYMAEKGFAPSTDEMTAHLGLASKSGVHRMLTGLEERGLIRRIFGRARAIEVVEKTGPNARQELARRIVGLMRQHAELAKLEKRPTIDQDALVKDIAAILP